jgi:dolichol-phosphate mannosyltransferase
MAPKTLIFIPTYDERDNVRPMCEQIFALGLDADLLFLDDASPDGTGKILDAMAAQRPRMRVIHRGGKFGIGGAHLEGIALAYAEAYQRLVTLDCDFTHSPALIPTFLKRANTADVVVGSRYVRHQSLPGWSRARRILTGAGHIMTKNLLGIPQDATGAFRTYNLESVPREVFDLVQSKGYAFFFESMLVLQRNGFAVAEIPIRLPARAAGHSKMSGTEIRRSITTLLGLLVADQTDPARFRLPASGLDGDSDLDASRE